MTSFHKVIGNGCVLNWPPSIEQQYPARGRIGYVVDLDAPLEREWCKGQEYKLAPAPDATAANPINNPVAARAIAAFLAKQSAPSGTAPAAAGGDDLEVKPRRTAKAGV